ncbi:MAG: L-2-amino-thiazoline-4-carboxylic acid hydrolase [Lachnospiraceae bacterium]|nr:L-2-amino-thiazoline-4-carboxylic acid hydrolase [Lachnospiraceae bacterium]
MKYGMMERLFWTVFKGGYKRELENTLHIENSGEIMKKAHKKYKEMIENVQEFRPRNRFVSNIILASILGSVYISMDEKPSVEKMIIFNREAVMNNKMMLKSVVSEKNYTKEGQKALADGAKQSKNDHNPYSWQYDFQVGKSLMEFTTYFKSCGICYLYKQWGIPEITPAMCRLDYDIAHANNTEFLREQTLFEGGEYCDCHYIHTPQSKAEIIKD